MNRFLQMIKIAILLCGMFLLTGCSLFNRKVDLSQVKADIPQDVKEIFVDSQKIKLNVQSFEVERRMTEKNYDKIYCDMVMSNDEYQIKCTYVCEYQYYNPGGWVLEKYQLADVEIKCLADIPSALKFEMNTTCIYGHDVRYEVQSVECIHTGTNKYEIVYNINSDYLYCDIGGVYKCKCSLVSKGGRNYSWEKEDDYSGVVYTWDIVGSYAGGGTSAPYAEYEIVIDSYNQDTKEADIAYFKRIDRGLFSGGKIEKYDFTVTLEECELNEEEQYLSLYINTSQDGWYFYFTKDRFKRGGDEGWTLERIN